MLQRARQILVSELTFALNVDEETAEERLNDGANRIARSGRTWRWCGRSWWPPARVGASATASSSPPRRATRARMGSRRVPSLSSGVVLVVPDDRSRLGFPRRRCRRGGRLTRADWCARVAAVPDDTEVVVVHDAARPLASACALRGRDRRRDRRRADGAVPGLAVVDTIKTVGRRLPRHQPRWTGRTLVAVQTPQAFRAGSCGGPTRRAAAGAPTTPCSSRRSAAPCGWSPGSRATSRSPTPTT